MSNSRLKYVNIVSYSNDKDFKFCVTSVDESGEFIDWYETIENYQADHIVLLFRNCIRISTINSDEESCSYCVFRNSLIDPDTQDETCSFFSCNYDVFNKHIIDGYYEINDSYHLGGLYKNIYCKHKLNEFLKYHSEKCPEDKVLIIKINPYL